MPVTVLLVEGELDLHLLGSFVPSGTVTIERGGSKGSLAPQARERRRKHVAACYIRDRDFDHEPPLDRSQPAVDKVMDGGPLGWRWCRHSMESYLLDPRVVAAATGWPAEDFSRELLAAGARLTPYTAVRWELGQIRRRVEDVRYPRTNPWSQDGEFWLPEDQPLAANVREGYDHLLRWSQQLTLPERQQFTQQCEQRADALKKLADVDDVLIWHGGKNLFAALGDPLMRRLKLHPGSFRVRLRDWVREHRDEVGAIFPEWSALLSLLRGD